MKAKVIVAAVAAAFASPAALAQSSATIGGTIMINWETAKALGATGGRISDLLPRDRVTDGYTSNIRFTLAEDLGGGNSAFVRVESAVIGNADNARDLVGNGGGIFPAPFASGNNVTIWGNRNSGIGLRSKTAGTFLIGSWDTHFNMFYFAEGWVRTLATPGASSLALFQNFGAPSNANLAIGLRYSNIIRWDSPTWNGINLEASYARPSDGPPLNVPGDVRHGRKNRAWSFSPRFESGDFRLAYSYLNDKDAVTNTSISFAGVPVAGGVSIPAAWKVTSNRLAARYKFANGIWASAIWDSSTMSNITNVAGGQIHIKRSVWALPLSYATGNHTISATYAKANNWSGSIGGVGMHAFASGRFNLGSDTGAKFVNFLYAYSLSRRTALYASYQKVINRPLARYDFFTVPVGLGAANFGADPTTFALGMRHNF